MNQWLMALIGFAGAFVVGSFIEWAVHHFLMHRPFWSFGYRHTTSHHARFLADETYHARTEEDRRHILFTWKEYLLFPALCLALYAPVGWWLGWPLVAGGLAATFAGLQMFNSLHWRYHVPRDTWFQRTRFFQFLKRHHRIHHADMGCNFNVHFLPLADACLGTLRVEMPTYPYPGPPQKPARSSGNSVAPCVLCGRVVDDFCPDCRRPLCLRAECDRGHVASCAPVRRAVMTRDAEWR